MTDEDDDDEEEEEEEEEKEFKINNIHDAMFILYLLTYLLTYLLHGAESFLRS